MLSAELELRDEVTLYVQLGDWIARTATAVALLTMLYYGAYRIRRRNHLVD